MDLFIYENGLNENDVIDLKPNRKTVRAIVKDQEKYALTYFPKYLLHGFIGGGIENDEDEITALKREVIEESGFKVKPLQRLCTIHSYAIRKEKIEYWHSTYYYCQLLSSGHPLKLEQYEKDFGLTIKWYNEGEVKDIFMNGTSKHPFGSTLYNRSLNAFNVHIEKGD